MASGGARAHASSTGGTIAASTTANSHDRPAKTRVSVNAAGDGQAGAGDGDGDRRARGCHRTTASFQESGRERSLPFGTTIGCRTRRERTVTAPASGMHATIVIWPPSRTSTPNAAASCRERPAHDGDQRAAAPARLGGDDAVGAVRLDDRELVHHGAEVPAPGGADQLARAEDHVDRAVGAVDRGDDRRARLDRALERRPVVRARSHIEHDEQRGAAASFVLAHHQLSACAPSTASARAAGRRRASTRAACGTRRSVRFASAPAVARGRDRVRRRRAAATRHARAGTRSPARSRARAASAPRARRDR